MKAKTISANILVRNEIKNIKGLVENLCEAGVDEILFLDGGSTDGTYEYLEEIELREPRVKLFRWPQPKLSEYKKGFNEVGRRNFLIEQSFADYILYVDADERVSLNIKNLVTGGADIIALSLVSYWGKEIRVNSLKDQVWYPMAKYRLFKRDPKIRFYSKDKNGLHNFLGFCGVKIPMPANKARWLRVIFQAAIALLPIKVSMAIDCACIYHYHYYHLGRHKVNDLRMQEFNWKIQEVDLHQDVDGDSIVYVSKRLAASSEAQYITETFWGKYQD